MAEQVWDSEEGCINGRTGLGGGVYQWQNRSGTRRRGVSMEEHVWEEGCISQVVIRGYICGQW